jgi:acetyl-CoA synthetase
MNNITHSVPENIKNEANIHSDRYQQWTKFAEEAPQTFWAERAKQYVTWFRPWEEVVSGSFKEGNVRWFTGGKLNAAYNCLDRHLRERGDQTALIWEGDEPGQSRLLSYRDLHQQVGCFANLLKQKGVKKGDTVCIYLPMIPEAAIAMLACARIGAIHTVVFAGFSAQSLKSRILDVDSCVVITANEGLRGGKVIPLKHNVDKALETCPQVKTVIVVKRTENRVDWKEGRDVWYHEAIQSISADCVAEEMSATDPLFILYTSGSTNTPKGIEHGTGGYLVFAAMTHATVFDYRPGEIYWCTADVGWITGHTYGIYGPLANGATTVMFEGIPTYPTMSRFWDIVDKHQVNIFYTAPTAIRALRREGDDWVTRTSRKSLRILGSVGEPINPETWEWYYNIVGEARCPVIDTWWQTETGGILISPLPGATPLKPGSAAWPFFGVLPRIIDEQGAPVPDDVMGRLVISQPWPGIMQTIHGDHQRFIDVYLKEVPGCYLTGDQATRDANGYYWIAGRSDDVIKVSGHRIGTEEVESALVQHHAVAEAGVVGVTDDIKGQAIYAFVTLINGTQPSEALKRELMQAVRDNIGAIAAPAYIQWADGLPKTRSGKIMRRILRKIANHETEDLGDLSTLADPDVVQRLISERIPS